MSAYPKEYGGCARFEGGWYPRLNDWLPRNTLFTWLSWNQNGDLRTKFLFSYIKSPRREGHQKEEYVQRRRRTNVWARNHEKYWNAIWDHHLHWLLQLVNFCWKFEPYNLCCNRPLVIRVDTANSWGSCYQKSRRKGRQFCFSLRIYVSVMFSSWRGT